MGMTNLEQKPEINFPCEWGYKVIGADKAKLETAIETSFGDKAYSIAKTAKSSKGNYTSISIKLTVFSQEEIDKFYNALSKQSDIKIVL